MVTLTVVPEDRLPPLGRHDRVEGPPRPRVQRPGDPAGLRERPGLADRVAVGADVLVAEADARASDSSPTIFFRRRRIAWVERVYASYSHSKYMSCMATFLLIGAGNPWPSALSARSRIEDSRSDIRIRLYLILVRISVLK